MSASELPETGSGAQLTVPGWVLAAAGAVAIHLGCVAAVFATSTPVEEDAALGSPAIEIDVELAAPRIEQTDLPPGPEAEASAASPAVQEQKEVVEKSERPKDTPTETDDPDRVVSPNPTEQPKEEEPTKAATAATPSAESVASEATAPPTSEVARESERSTAPAQGSGDSTQRIKAGWQKELVAHLNRHKRYPPGLARKSVQVVIGFTLDRLGHVVATNVVRGSGDTAFDEAALAMMKRSDPVPAPPARVADDGLTFTLPVIFREKGKG